MGFPWRRQSRPTPVFLPGESQGLESGGLASVGSHRVEHDLSDLAAAAAWASLVAQMVKNLPAVQETQVQSLGREDTLEKELATHSTTLAQRIP